MRWFTPPIAVRDAKKASLVRNITSVEAAAEQLLTWPRKGEQRDKAALILADALADKVTPEKARTAFEAAAKEAGMWMPYRGPL